MTKDFCIFILTHGRPDKVYTVNTLAKRGYTGNYYIVVDNEDTSVDEYISEFGDRVIVFDKLEQSLMFDEGDNFSDRRSIVYARNACFEIARNLGIKYFMQMDDDYDNFSYMFNSGLHSVKHDLNSLDYAISHLLDYYVACERFASIAIGQGGDYIGGRDSTNVNSVKTKRKAMNSFLCSTDRPFKFLGRINEDVNTYTCEQRKGLLFLSILQISLNQKQTQSSSGGMTDIYQDNGTYVKSFYSVMFAPSCTKIVEMGNTIESSRIHHKVNWNSAAPRIVRETIKV